MILSLREQADPKTILRPPEPAPRRPQEVVQDRHPAGQAAPAHRAVQPDRLHEDPVVRVHAAVLRHTRARTAGATSSRPNVARIRRGGRDRVQGRSDDRGPAREDRRRERRRLGRQRLRADRSGARGIASYLEYLGLDRERARRSGPTTAAADEDHRLQRTGGRPAGDDRPPRERLQRQGDHRRPTRPCIVDIIVTTGTRTPATDRAARTLTRAPAGAASERASRPRAVPVGGSVADGIGVSQWR